MIFNSYIYILAFLPACLFLVFAIGPRTKADQTHLVLIAFSLFFYGWWNPAYLGLIIGSILFNYFISNQISGSKNKHARKLLLILGISGNLSVLGIFKYYDFVTLNLNSLVGLDVQPLDLVLPLAISFFTFQQIAYLVDTYSEIIEEHNLVRYFLFITFFPQLIAGPIVHHKEMMPQFAKKLRFSRENLAIGLTFFAIGLFKKVVIADNLALYSTPVFMNAELGSEITLLEAWGGALAYTAQLYFDFSGYADMAIGSAKILGINLPLNFNSPYKATNIIDFWRRWHMTLSRFLRDYLYIPLGGNRKGATRRYANLYVTMFLGGIWHGAGWTFVMWGSLHGTYLIINHFWIFLLQRNTSVQKTLLYKSFAYSVTFLSVVLGWVFFRSETMSGALNIVYGMIGAHGLVLPLFLANLIPDGIIDVTYSATNSIGVFGLNRAGQSIAGFATIIASLAIAFALPNSQEISRKEILHSWWAPFFFAILFSISLVLISADSEFLYFQF